jgi:integrator complex subunit 10
MFQFFANGPAGQKIQSVMMSSDTELDFTYLKIMKKFSRNFNLSLLPMIDKILTGISNSPIEYTELLVKEALPLIMDETHLELSVETLYHLLEIVFKYHISNFYNHTDKKHLAEESRIKLADFFQWIGKYLNWEPFAYNSKISKDIFWQKLKQIESTKTCDNKQIFYLSCYLFFISAQDYLEATKVKIDGHEVQYILIDGLSEIETQAPLMNILHEPPFSTETLTSFLTAFKAQELLQRNVLFFQEFNKIIFELNVTRHINRLILDFAIYLRINNDSFNLINQSKLSSLEKNIRMLSLTINKLNSTRETFEYIKLIFNELPSVTGSFLKNLAPDRSLLFLPLTRNAIVQYCTRVVITCLKKKAFKENSMTKIDDFQIGSLLVLLQLEFYENIPLIEHIFEIIRVKGLEYSLFTNYIVDINLIEEFMSIHRSGEVKLKLNSNSTALTPTSRRIGTRGADRNQQSDFKQIIRQQVSRANENIVELIIQFIDQEHMNLLTNIMAF